MIKSICLAGVFLLISSTAIGEYYQYTDESGTVRFTDDMTQIPESRRDSVEKFASEISSGGETAAGSAYGVPEPERDPANAEVLEKYADPAAGETFEVRAAELNATHEQLDKTRQALEKERADLEAQAPPEDAKSQDRIDYSMKVDALNVKIEEYEKDLKAFQEKVKAFRGKSKAE